jgi:hypothetical protein
MVDRGRKHRRIHQHISTMPPLVQDGRRNITASQCTIDGKSRRQLAGGVVNGSLTAGDAAILRFLAAAEILESDLWKQY